MDNNTNSLNWFEIPVTDINRAKAFYETIFEISMEVQNMDDAEMAFFPFSPGSGKANGSLAKSPMHKPSTEGTIVYLNANPNMDAVLNKVENAGGKVITPKTAIGEHGNIAFIIDTEGNNIGIHSIN